MFELSPSMARGSDACPYSEASVSDLCDGFGSLEQILFGLLTSGQDPKILHRGFPGDPGFGSASALDVGDSCSAWDHHEGETGTFRHSASTNASTGPLTESANAESWRQPRTCQTNNFTNDMLHFSFSGWGNTFDPFGMDSAGSEIGSSTSSPLFRNDHGITMTSLPPTLSSEMTPVRPEIRVPPSAAACSCDDTTTASAFNDDEATRQDESCSGDDCGSTPPMAGINTIWEMDRKDYHALSPKERRRVRNRVSARVARAKRRGELAFLSDYYKLTKNELAATATRAKLADEEVERLRAQVAKLTLKLSIYECKAAQSILEQLPSESSPFQVMLC